MKKVFCLRILTIGAFHSCLYGFCLPYLILPCFHTRTAINSAIFITILFSVAITFTIVFSFKRIFSPQQNDAGVNDV